MKRLDPAVTAALVEATMPVVKRLRGQLNGELARLKAEGHSADFATEVVVQAGLALLDGSLKGLLAAGPSQLRVYEMVIARLMTSAGLPRERILPDEMTR